MLFIALVIPVLSNENYNKIDPFILYGVHLLIIFLSLIAILIKGSSEHFSTVNVWPLTSYFSVQSQIMMLIIRTVSRAMV